MKAQYKQQASLGDIQATRMLKKLEQMDSYGDIGFDTVLIPDYGTSLKSAVAMFGYYDVFSPDVKFIGTSIWENTALNKESTMVGSWYPSLTRQNNSYFFNKYTELFEERPSSLYAFGYDAVALASAIVRNGKDELDSKITNPEGYLGINGVFRFFPNGLNQHSLDIKEVRASGNYIVDPGPRKFKDIGDQETIESETFYKPSIYGKKQATAEILIYGRTISDDEYQTEEDDVVVY
jgi:hypothetical protein